MSPDVSSIQRISVFGLGKLGACIAATLASRGFQVVGYDVDRCKTDSLERRIAPIEETRIQKTIDEAGTRLKPTNDIEEAVAHSEALFFVPSTPSLPDGSFSSEYLVRAIESAASVMPSDSRRRPLFVINSTLTPGTCDRVLRPLLERKLRGVCGEDFGLCYNPEFIALGDVISGLLRPDFVLIGESDPCSGVLLQEVYNRLCTNSPSVEHMSMLNAELAKISLNCAVTMKISFVNQLSSVCAQIPGADPGIILRAIGKDRRIGLDYLKPGLGFGGPCFPRDNQLFQYVARSVGVEAALSFATDKINEDVNRRLLETVLAQCSDRDSIAVLGLAYKPFTAVVDRSPGMWLCQQLTDRGRQVFAHDYFAINNAATVLAGGRIRILADPMEVLENGCKIFVITCPWPDYVGLFKSSTDWLSRRGAVVVDPWRLLETRLSQVRDVRYITNLGSKAANASELVAGA